MSGNEGCARRGTSVADLRHALLSLPPSPSLGRVLSIVHAERLIAEAREITMAGARQALQTLLSIFSSILWCHTQPVVANDHFSNLT